jgi:AraC-like DNA-binding protein
MERRARTEWALSARARVRSRSISPTASPTLGSCTRSLVRGAARLALVRDRQKKAPTPGSRKEPSFAERTSTIDDPRGPLGVRLLVQRRGEHARLAAERTTVILPIETGIVDVSVGALRPMLDPSAWLLVPRGALAVITAKSVVAQTIVLTISPELVARVAKTYPGEVDVARYDQYVRAPQLLVRTTWVNEICHRYLFERAACKKRDNDATRFLETEIAKELYFLCHERQRALERPSLVARRSPVIRRALRHVEDHLFEADVLRDLAKASGASPSTLLRAFKREVGEGPLAYVRTRRLDEALLLLKSRSRTVGEVSALVGYRNLGAFSYAFRTRFGVRPSDVYAVMPAREGPIATSPRR